MSPSVIKSHVLHPNLKKFSNNIKYCIAGKFGELIDQAMGY